jgi:serine/threonine protein kinase
MLDSAIYLRSKGIISRDIKPLNILNITEEHFIMTDLGEAKSYDVS